MYVFSSLFALRRETFYVFKTFLQHSRYFIMRIALIFILLLNAIAAITGGWMLISEPTGSTLDMPVSMLDNSPFSNFYVPGILLFLFNGICSLIVAIAVFMRSRHRYWMLMLQGMISLVWIVAEVIMIRAISWQHYLFGIIAIILLIAGSKREKEVMQEIT